MGITPNDIAAQRAMLERGEEKRKADWKQAERERLRDTFAAAALTGMMSRVSGKAEEFAEAAYKLADEMLIQRSPRTGFVAADKAIQDAKDFVRIREQFEAWQKEASAHSGRSPISHDRRIPQSSTVGVAEMDSATDRKSAATPRACASSCSQPFDSAPTTQVCPHIRGTVTQHCSLNFTLTDEEREAVRFFAQIDGPQAVTLRSLLSRLSRLS
jgi:FAD/FMN-containing dehydrogenase